MKHLTLTILALLLSFAALADDGPTVDAIAAVIDDFHDAAAHGDSERYLGHMTDDAVFMGTDEWERWPKHPDFEDYVNGRFKDGTGWEYRSVQRNVSVSELGNVAWFDEVIFSASNGRFRGTGVLLLQDGEWKIARYAMSFLVFNENWDEVIELTRKTSEQKQRE
jgi:ketosteroid isomerase-like protein